MSAIKTLVMAVFGLMVRMAFILYTWLLALLAVFLVAALLLGLPAYLYCNPASLRNIWVYPLLFILLVLVYAIARPGAAQDNPHRQYPGLRGRLDARIDEFIAWIGTLKYFMSPLCLVADPGSYKIKGPEIRDLIDKQLQAGDILLRGYDGYLDGVMIRLSGGGQNLGAYFSHAALYLGELDDKQDREIAARRLQVQNGKGQWIPASAADQEAIRNNREYFQKGRQMVVHAMTRGVFVEDILTFLRCDYLIVLRLHESMKLDTLEKDNSLIKDLPADAEAIHGRLMQGATISRDEVVKASHNSALGKIGSCYDFQFNDIKTAHRFSCSEFVYYCYKSIHCYLGLEPRKHAFLKYFLRRNTITPSDIYDIANGQSKLQVVWQSKSLQSGQ